MKNLYYILTFTLLILISHPLFGSNPTMVINSVLPAPGNIQINETVSQNFVFSGYDSDGDNLYFVWELNTVSVSIDSSYNYVTDYSSAGNYNLTLAVRDTLLSQPDTVFSWSVEVLESDQHIIVNDLIPAEGSINISETDSIQFIFSGYDPDGNTLDFNWELDSLQVSTDSTFLFNTNYSSAGSYLLELNVTDNFSRNDTLFQWTINVQDVDQPIVVTDINPAPGIIIVNESESVYFTFNGLDPDGNTLTYNWQLDSTIVTFDNTYLYQSDFSSAGQHLVDLNVSDGFTRNDTSFHWTVNVNDVDQLIVVEQLVPPEGSIALSETDSLLFLFSGYDPDGNSLNYNWELDSMQVSVDSTYLQLTDHNSAGIYNLQLTVSDQFSRNDTIFNWSINISDLDRPVVIDSLSPSEGFYQINELEQLDFYISGFDPDGNVLEHTWQLDSLVVSVDSVYSYITDHSSAGLHEIELFVSDNYSRNDTLFSWQIEVLDVDQLIIIDSLFPEPDSLTIAELDSIQFYVNAHDPDGNLLTYEWILDSISVATDSSFILTTDHSSAGLYDLFLNVSDNFTRNDISFYWQIEITDVDQEIVIDSLFPTQGAVVFDEFELYEFGFSGSDPDGSPLIYEWILDSILVSTDSIYTFVSDHASSGLYELILNVDDGFSLRNSLQFSWQLTVNNITTFLVPYHLSTIQAAIDVCVDGDTVLVDPGEYFENIDFSGKNIKVSSLYLENRDPALIDSTIINGSDLGSVVTFNSGEDSTAVLRGFTINNGSSSNGGGIYIEASSPALADLKVTENTASARGGGIYCLNADIDITDCQISSNSAFIGAGAEFYNSSAFIINAQINDNSASFIGGGLESYNSQLEIYNTVINSNTSTDLDGGGIAGYNNSGLIIVHSILNDNSASYGGGISLHTTDMILKNSIISNNINYGLYFENGSLDVSYSDFWNNSNANFYNCGPDIGVNSGVNINGDPCDIYFNIQLDPLFADAGMEDFSLTDISLCIGSGDSLSFPNFDKNYEPRPYPVASKPDLGAFENSLGSPFDAPPVVEVKIPAADTLAINETDSLVFFISAYDPNGREIFYSWELDSLEVSTDTTFTFHTDYFSSGTHQLDCTITDLSDFSRAETVIQWIIEVSDVDREIVVNYIEPAVGDSAIIESDSIRFEFSGFDPDLHQLIFNWQVDSVNSGSDSTFMFQTDFSSAGSYDVSLSVTDGFDNRNILLYNWTVNVENVTTFYVPELVATIQGAIDVSVNGDTIIVAPGLYIENIDFLGKEIIVGSLFFTTNDTSYISQTIIDGSSQTNKSLVTFIGQENENTELTGFTLTNGAGYNGNGGGIRCENSSPSLKDLVIIENSAYTGGGVYCNNGSHPQLSRCRIIGNIAFEGGGIFIGSNSSPDFINCLIYDNNAISHGGAIKVDNSDPQFIHNTITNNSSDDGSAVYLLNNAQPSFKNSIIWNNYTDEFTILDTLSDLNVSYSIIRGSWAGEENLNVDPLFNDAENNDYSCSNYSYSIGGGDPSALIDHDISASLRPDPPGSNPDLGVFESDLAVPIDGPIIINEIEPSPGYIELNETYSVEFYIRAYDLNGASLDYSWQLDSEEVSVDSNFIFTTDLNSAGDYFLLLTVTDNYSYRNEERSQTGFAWNITVLDLIPPEIPENITITVVNDSIQICWDPVEGAVSYKLYSAGLQDGVYEEELAGDITGTCWTSTVSDRTRYYRVTAIK
jgi:hypothetical protein